MILWRVTINQHLCGKNATQSVEYEISLKLLDIIVANDGEAKVFYACAQGISIDSE